MSIVVTGATGHLGRATVEELLALGVPPHEVLATGRAVERLTDLADRGVRTARVDHDDPATIDPALAPGDVVLLVSGPQVGVRVAQHGAVIDAAARAGVARLVYTSVLHAPTTSLPVAPDHVATEEHLVASGVPFTLVRNGWYHENYLPTLLTAAATGEVVSSAGTARVASAARADFAAAAAAVLVAEGQEGAVHELTGDVAWSQDELAATLADVLGRPVVHRAVDPDEHRAILLAAGLDEGTAGFLVALDAGIAAGELDEVTDDLRRLIGRSATPLAETLRAAAPSAAGG